MVGFLWVMTMVKGGIVMCVISLILPTFLNQPLRSLHCLPSFYLYNFSSSSFFFLKIKLLLTILALLLLLLFVVESTLLIYNATNSLFFLLPYSLWINLYSDDGSQSHSLEQRKRKQHFVSREIINSGL